jgi:MoaA/NifB/PqqE/SkfB family radical SAM enzyme
MAKSKKTIINKKNMKEFEYNDKIIEDLGLTEMQILNIISVWYVNGMMPDIIQNEDGWELDELVDERFWLLFEEKKIIKKATIIKNYYETTKTRRFKRIN